MDIIRKLIEYSLKKFFQKNLYSHRFRDIAVRSWVGIMTGTSCHRDWKGYDFSEKPKNVRFISDLLEKMYGLYWICFKKCTVYIGFAWKNVRFGLYWICLKKCTVYIGFAWKETAITAIIREPQAQSLSTWKLLESLSNTL